MRIEYAILIAHSLSLTQGVVARTFSLTKQWQGTDFLNGDWDYYSGPDPTHGYVDYQDLESAISQNLVHAKGTLFFMHADSSEVVPSSARGRRSVRISSKATFGDSVIVLDISHMPTGCATWPAFWTDTNGGPWPNGGEIDIIEGINNNSYNQMGLHTSPSCTIPQQRSQSGTIISNICTSTPDANTGCMVSSPSNSSYGEGFNEGKGGFYVLSRSEEAIKVWFWVRNDSSVPPAIRYGPDVSLLLDPDLFGVPVANFPMVPGFCDYNQHFDAHKIIFDLTFCGDWAGSAYSSSGCGPQTCQDFVANNPGSFQQAYWDIKGLRVYT